MEDIDKQLRAIQHRVKVFILLFLLLHILTLGICVHLILSQIYIKDTPVQSATTVTSEQHHAGFTEYDDVSTFLF